MNTKTNQEANSLGRAVINRLICQRGRITVLQIKIQTKKQIQIQTYQEANNLGRAVIIRFICQTGGFAV